MRPFLHCYELHWGVSNCFRLLICLISQENGSFEARTSGARTVSNRERFCL